MSNDGGLTEEDVVETYKVFLEREPESAEVIALHRADLLASRGDVAGARALIASVDREDRTRCFPGRLAEVHVACQLAHHQKVNASGHHFRL